MRIGVWGDSIAYGSCDMEGLGWVGRLRKKFSSDKDGPTVYNRGISGDTTQDLLKRFSVELESIKPEVVILAIGTNDSIYRGEESNRPISVEETKSNLQKFIEDSKRFAQKVYVVGLTRVTESLVQPIPWSSTGKCYSNVLMQTYDEALKEVTERSGAVFIPVSNLLGDADLSDGLHPNSQGYQKLYQAVSSALKDSDVNTINN